MADSSPNNAPSSAPTKPAAAAKPAAPKGPTLLDAETHGLSAADKLAFQKRKAEMGAAARREAQKLMISIFVSFGVLILVAVLWNVISPRGTALTVVLLTLVAADLCFFAYIGWVIGKHWHQGKAAQARHKERLAAIQAARTAGAPAAPAKPGAKPDPVAPGPK